MRVRRSSSVVLPLAAALLLLPSCGDDDDSSSSSQAATSTEAAASGSSALEDRLEELAGAGVFVGGVALTSNLVAVHLDRTNEDAIGMRVFVRTVSDDGIAGELTLPGQEPRVYFAAPAGQGAGIYTVVVDDARHHTGTSAQGASMDLIYEDGTVMGVLKSPEGEEFAMLGADLAEAYRYDDVYSKPGTYIAFVAPAVATCTAATGTCAVGSRA